MYGGWDASNIGGYEGGWNPGDYLQGDAIKDIPPTTYHTKAGHPYLDIRAWAEARDQNEASRDKMLTNIYMSAKMMKYHPQITKDLKKSYGLLASAAMRAMSKQKKWEMKKAMAPYNHAKRALAAKVAAEKEKLGIAKRKGLQGRIDY